MLVIISIQLLYIYKNRIIDHYEPESKNDLTDRTEKNLAKLKTYTSSLINLKDKLIHKSRLVLERKNIENSLEHINHVREEM